MHARLARLSTFVPAAARPAGARGLLTQTFEDYVVPSYGRYTDLELDRGDGHRVWATRGTRYLEMGGGIAGNALGASRMGV
jgi:acetylornithine/succinyldiaminopimelate/putrescine aminotransferase